MHNFSKLMHSIPLSFTGRYFHVVINFSNESAFVKTFLSGCQIRVQFYTHGAKFYKPNLTVKTFCVQSLHALSTT